MNPLETFRLVVVYLLPALLALLLGTPSSPAGASPSFPSSNDANARRAPPGSAAVFVDGSVTQGKPAGVGVWYGVGHPLNFAAALPSPTFDDNNLAELAAVFVALIRHPRNAPMKIHTDSAYVIQTLNPDRSPTMNRCRPVVLTRATLGRRVSRAVRRRAPRVDARREAPAPLARRGDIVPQGEFILIFVWAIRMTWFFVHRFAATSATLATSAPIASPRWARDPHLSRRSFPPPRRTCSRLRPLARGGQSC